MPVSRFLFVHVAAVLALVAPALAETVKAPGIEAVFPCQTKQEIQSVKTPIGAVPVTTRTCTKAEFVYSLVVSEYPKGFIAKRTAAAALQDAIQGAAENVQGTVRTNTSVYLGEVAGREARIEVTPDNAVVHVRVFFVGDRQYQVMAMSTIKSADAKPVTDFLGSIRVTQEKAPERQARNK